MERGIDPQDQREIEEQITEKGTPDFTGEEGYLYTVQLPDKTDKTLWAKQWHLSLIDEIGLKFDGSLTSPYFHEMKRIEYEMIHDAFPEITVEMYGSYDPRIKDDKKTFRFFPGRPTTVTVEVSGDPGLTRSYRDIIDVAYVRLRRERGEMEQAGLYTWEETLPTVSRWSRDVHGQIYKLLGPELYLPIIDGGTTIKKSVKRAISIMKGKSPNNTMLQLLETGIRPIHPQINFIPGTKETHPQPPHGTFIELSIYNLEQLERKMKEKMRDDQPSLEAFKQKLAYFKILHELNSLFGRVIFWARQQQEQPSVELHQVVQSALFRFSEKTRLCYLKGDLPLDVMEKVFMEFGNRLVSEIKRHRKKPEFIAHFIDNYVPPKEF